MRERIDDCAKNCRPGESDFSVGFTANLWAVELNEALISLLFQILRICNYVYGL